MLFSSLALIFSAPRVKRRLKLDDCVRLRSRSLFLLSFLFVYSVEGLVVFLGDFFFLFLRSCVFLSVCFLYLCYDK